MYLTKAKTCAATNSIFLPTLLLILLLFQISNNSVQELQTGSEAAQSEGLQPPPFLVLLVSRKRFGVGKTRVCLQIKRMTEARIRTNKHSFKQSC